MSCGQLEPINCLQPEMEKLKIENGRKKKKNTLENSRDEKDEFFFNILGAKVQ